LSFFYEAAESNTTRILYSGDRMSAVPTGLQTNFVHLYPTLKRGASNRCAYGAVYGLNAGVRASPLV
jgi:hypothetical protein